MEYKIELLDSMDSYVRHRVESVTEKVYGSLEEAIAAIKKVGFMNVPFLEEAVKWRSVCDNHKLQIEIQEWPIYQNTPHYQVGKIRRVAP